MTKEKFLYGLNACAVTYHNGQKVYEHDDLVKCFEDLELFEQEPTVAQERYEDLCEYFGGAKDILNSRKDFKAWLGRIKWHIHKAEELYEKYEQEPKTGHWIYTDYHTWCCSECGGNPHRGTGFVPNKDGMKMRWKYCNLCGARMIEPQERSGDERY